MSLPMSFPSARYVLDPFPGVRFVLLWSEAVREVEVGGEKSWVVSLCPHARNKTGPQHLFQGADVADALHLEGACG